jgi:DNA-binding LacI/PurR family transcriptional regulator
MEYHGQAILKRPPALRDVAQAAGVSHQTVSRVINAHPSVAPETRQRVQQVIDELGYRPNNAARSLVTSRTYVIGVVVMSTNLFGPSRTLLGVEGAARQRGFWVSFASVTGNDEKQAADAVKHFTSQGVDGVIVIAHTEPTLRGALFMSEAFPMVLVTSGFTIDKPVSRIDTNQVAGSLAARDHLIGLGHRRIAHIAGTDVHVHARQRQAVWRDSLEQAGLEPGPVLKGDWSAASGYAAGQELLQTHRDATAVFVSNDTMALGLLRAIHDAGLDCPRDMSVVGFDDSPGVDQSIPPLTTVHQDTDELGAAAVDLLVETISSHEPQVRLIDPYLIIRDSTCPPPVSDRS